MYIMNTILWHRIVQKDGSAPDRRGRIVYNEVLINPKALNWGDGVRKATSVTQTAYL